MRKKTTTRGFTLVEILIVVIILAILAVIVIPQFANATADAKRASLSDQLHHIRVQIQLYTLQHGDTSPPLNGGDWSSLVNPSTFNGKPTGPYLPSVPKNMLNGFSDVAVVAANPAFGDPVAGSNIGFVYNPTTGVIWATNTAGDRIYNEANPNDPNN